MTVNFGSAYAFATSIDPPQSPVSSLASRKMRELPHHVAGIYTPVFVGVRCTLLPFGTAILHARRELTPRILEMTFQLMQLTLDALQLLLDLLRSKPKSC